MLFSLCSSGRQHRHAFPVPWSERWAAWGRRGVFWHARKMSGETSKTQMLHLRCRFSEVKGLTVPTRHCFLRLHCFRAPGWTIRDAPLQLLLMQDPLFQMTTFSVSSCVLNPTGWKSNEFLHPPSHSLNRTDQECCFGYFVFCFFSLGMTWWSDSCFKWRDFILQSTAFLIPASLYGRSSEAAKHV